MKLLKNFLVFLLYVIAFTIVMIYLYYALNFLNNIAFSNDSNTSQYAVANAAITSIFTIYLVYNFIIRLIVFLARKITKASPVSEFVHLFSAFFGTVSVIICAQFILSTNIENRTSVIPLFSQPSEAIKTSLYVLISSLILTILNLSIKFVRSLA